MWDIPSGQESEDRDHLISLNEVAPVGATLDEEENTKISGSSLLTRYTSPDVSAGSYLKTSRQVHQDD